jgi:hypothetical protein
MSYVQAFRKRIETDKRSTFAIARVLERGEQKVGGDTVRHVYLPDPKDEPFITTPEGRKKSIVDGVETWGAAGVTPLVEQENRRYLAVLMRDAKAPSWPNAPVVACGLYNLVDGKQERFRSAAVREFEEEIVFFRDEKEYRPSYKLLSTNDTVVEVYAGVDLVDVFHPFVIAWGTPKDTITTPLILGTMKLPEGAAVTDGEIVNGKPLCRDVLLLDLDDVRKDMRSVRAKRFVMKDYELTKLDDTVNIPALPQNPVVVLSIERLRKMTEKEIDGLF